MCQHKYPDLRNIYTGKEYPTHEFISPDGWQEQQQQKCAISINPAKLQCFQGGVREVFSSRLFDTFFFFPQTCEEYYMSLPIDKQTCGERIMT